MTSKSFQRIKVVGDAPDNDHYSPDNDDAVPAFEGKDGEELRDILEEATSGASDNIISNSFSYNSLNKE